MKDLKIAIRKWVYSSKSYLFSISFSYLLGRLKTHIFCLLGKPLCGAHTSNSIEERRFAQENLRELNGRLQQHISSDGLLYLIFCLSQQSTSMRLATTIVDHRHHIHHSKRTKKSHKSPGTKSGLVFHLVEWRQRNKTTSPGPVRAQNARKTHCVCVLVRWCVEKKKYMKMPNEKAIEMCFNYLTKNVFPWHLKN